MLCYAILLYTILYYTILYYTIIHYTILYFTILYYYILYYTIGRDKGDHSTEENQSRTSRSKLLWESTPCC